MYVRHPASRSSRSRKDISHLFRWKIFSSRFLRFQPTLKLFKGNAAAAEGVAAAASMRNGFSTITAISFFVRVGFFICLVISRSLLSAEKDKDFLHLSSIFPSLIKLLFTPRIHSSQVRCSIFLIHFRSLAFKWPFSRQTERGVGIPVRTSPSSALRSLI